MSRAGRLTWSRTCLINIDFCIITEILIPFIRSPFLCIRQFGLRIGNFASVLQTQLLSQFGCTNRTYFHALAAGNAFLSVHVSPVGRCGHIRCVK